jgi:3-oxoacyl-[acyl-carrier protein] reductase
MIDPKLKDKVVLITGGNHGIGAATARTFARQGARVFITYYRSGAPTPPEALQEILNTADGGFELYTALQNQPVEPLLDEIRSMGVSCAAWKADLGDTKNIPELFDRCESSIGPVDVLVNNHTHCELETFDPDLVNDDGFRIVLTNAASIDRHFDVNTRAYVLLMQEFVLRYLDRGGKSGRIINLSTDAAHEHPANISYAASKHAIESYTRSAAAELGKYAITANIVAPGPTQTGYITPQSEGALVQETPLGRLGQPEDIADVIVFLASHQARWITGQLLYVGGGYRMSQ